MGCVITSLAHGLSSSCGFIVAGFVYDRTQSRNSLSYKGYVYMSFQPVFSQVWFIFILANMSFPFTLNFIGELLNLISLADIDGELTACFLIFIFLTASQSLFLQGSYVFNTADRYWFIGTVEIERMEELVLFVFSYGILFSGFNMNARWLV